MIQDLLFGETAAHAIFILAAAIALGASLSKLKIKGVSLGSTWILFVGLLFGHLQMGINPAVLSFIKDFGLILFIYSIGMQVGPGFFSSFKKQGIGLNLLAFSVVLLGILTTCIIHWVSGTNFITLIGVMTGATTNTPSMGAAQQAYADLTGTAEPTIALGYAVAYPLGVIGMISAIILLKALFKIDVEKEDAALREALKEEAHTADLLTVRITNPQIDGRKVSDVGRLINRSFVISRIMHEDNSVELAEAQSILHKDDRVFIVSDMSDTEAVVAFLGVPVKMDYEDWEEKNKELVSRRMMVTNPNFNGKPLGNLHLRSRFSVNVTRINRAGVELVATPSLEIQIGDRVTAVGTEMALQDVSRMLGNSMKKLREPNIIPMFVGILLGVFVGTIPLHISGIPLPVKLGLAGGPMMVAILISRFGPHLHMVTYTTISASLMLREIGISLFLAAVGISSGGEFISTVLNGGYFWILQGFLITIIPVLLIGFISRKWLKLDYFSMMGMLAGGMCNPMALAFINSSSPNEQASVSYSTVYPLTMFLRVIFAQILIILAI